MPKYQDVFEALRSRIVAGEFRRGERLPSEAKLVKQFGTSRITVGRAVRELQQEGLVERRVGSGTYVRGGRAEPGGLLFGLLIPDLGRTEIFEPICQGMARAPRARPHALLWGNLPEGAGSEEEQALELCRQYIARGVSGVFFAPFELTPERDAINARITEALDRAGIPMVLLDRCVARYPRRSRYDLVGIDNRRAGYLVTEHLLERGCRRIAFIGLPDSASTVDARIAGYREALQAYGAPADATLVERMDPSEPARVRELMEQCWPQGFVCANDRTAAHLMQSLLGLGYRIPDHLRLAGIDDVEYARLLPVPLTTLRQPCQEMGAAAVSAMLDRIAHPEMPARDILLDCKLIVRQSSGG
ncbi:MAG TPA: GntR family transcriptional regulator [Bryobacteraceae bacterium]|nr:GntR family transcriptional regulator [Bryobacteraceae bacterium]